MLHFPSDISTLRKSIRLASVGSSYWHDVSSALENAFPETYVSFLTVDMRAAEGTAFESYFREANGSMTWCSSGAASPPQAFIDLGTLTPSAPPLRELGSDGTDEAEDRCRQGRQVLTFSLCRYGTTCLLLTVCLPNRDADYLSAISPLLQRLKGDIETSFHIARMLTSSTPLPIDSIRNCWDEIEEGVILLNQDLVPLVMNTAAEDGLTSRRFFAPLVRGGALRASTRADQNRLETARRRLIFCRSTAERVVLHGTRISEMTPYPPSPVLMDLRRIHSGSKEDAAASTDDRLTAILLPATG